MNIRRLIAIVLVAIAGVVFKNQAPERSRVEYSTLSGVFIIDGDTIKAQTAGKSENIRLIGIDAPELTNNDRSEKQSAWWQCSVKEVNRAGAKAKEALQAVIGDGTIQVEYGEEPVDQFGRKLGYVFVAKGKERIFVNAELLKSGLSRRLKVASNKRYNGILDDAQESARENRKGLWSSAFGCKF